MERGLLIILVLLVGGTMVGAHRQQMAREAPECPASLPTLEYPAPPASFYL